MAGNPPELNPLGGLDDIIDDADFSEQSISLDRYINALIGTYARVIIERESKGDLYKGFSREDYLRHRNPDDPHRAELEKIFGSWEEVAELVPRGKGALRRRANINDAISEFFDNLSQIGDHYGVSPPSVTARMYHEYAKSHDEIIGWRAYANRIVGSEKWAKAVKIACDVIDFQELSSRKGR